MTQPNSDKPTKYSPRQIRFAMLYYLPNSPTYGNALQSAKDAGYSDDYARNITFEKERANLKWIDDIVQEITGKPPTKKKLVEKSKKVLEESLESGDAKIKQDTAKFIMNTDKEFSSKQDITSNGESISAPIALVEFVDGQGKNTDTD